MKFCLVAWSFNFFSNILIYYYLIISSDANLCFNVSFFGGRDYYRPCPGHTAPPWGEGGWIRVVRQTRFGNYTRRDAATESIARRRTRVVLGRRRQRGLQFAAVRVHAKPHECARGGWMHRLAFGGGGTGAAGWREKRDGRAHATGTADDSTHDALRRASEWTRPGARSDAIGVRVTSYAHRCAAPGSHDPDAAPPPSEGKFFSYGKLRRVR